MLETDVTQHPDFTFLLFSRPDEKLEATFEADALGQSRVGAASAVAMKYLAYAASGVFVTFGAGWRAESQIEVVARILPHLRRVLVVD